MFKHALIGLAAVTAVLSLASPALAQTPAAAPPPSYTFAAEWDVPRAQWANWAADFDKNTRPVLEKLAAAGTLTGWGAYEMVVHTKDGNTHGVWWIASSIAGIEKARAELVKASAASASLAAATGHNDLLLRSIAGAGKPGSGTDAYLTVSQYLLKPGSGQEWLALWNKHTKPAYDELMTKGVLIGYAVDVEDIHTDNPGWRSIVTVTPSAEAEDQFVAALDAADAKRTPEERKTISLQMAALVEPGSHRDMYAKILRHWSK